MPHLLYYLICLSVLCSCNARKSGPQKGREGTSVTTLPAPEERVRIVNSIRLVSPVRNKEYRFGDVVDIKIEKRKKLPVDSAIVTFDGKEVARLAPESCTATFTLPEGRAGKHSVRLTVWHPDKKQAQAATSIVTIPDRAPQPYGYKVEKVFPHSTAAYTQGLIYHQGHMYEGTGQYGESCIRKIDMKNGKELSVLNIDSELFGEGVTIYKDKIYQITWRDGKGFVYDLASFSLESTFTYNSEGWGITTAGNHLIMSDGSNRLYHVDPSSFGIIREVEVYDHNGKVDQLNELEYVNGLVWANVWLTDRIVAIDPETGVVKAELDMTDLLSPKEKAAFDDKDDVLNGIAWNPETGRFYVTGKRWKKLFEISIFPKGKATGK